MGIVSDDEFDVEKGKLVPSNSNPTINNNSKISDTKISDTKIIDVNKGRGHNPEVPNSLRQIIGEESAINGRSSGLDLASHFGISPSSVSAYDVGATSTASYGDRPNLPQINEAKERISKRARSKLMRALHHLTDDKLENAKARDLAGIAKDMSAVVKNMEPEVPKIAPTDGPTFVFYAPQYRKEEHFDVIQVKE